MKVGTTLCVIALAAASAQAAPAPAPEVYSADKVDLPPVPDFASVASAGDVHDAKELRVAGQPLLDTDIKVRGYVIWIYDCVSAIRTPGESKPATQERIDADPTLCERAKLYLGETKTTPPEKGLWVVDFPRPRGKLEKERLPKEKLDAWPAVPKVKVGDYVTITGHFAVQSPHKERNSDGLLVFTSIEPARPGRSGKPTPMALRARAAPAIPKAPPAQPVAIPARDHSILASNDGNRLLGLKQYKEALAKYDEALTQWPDNQLAAYGAGIAEVSLQQYASAKAYLDHAIDVAPDQPMFQLFDGIAAYEAKVEANRKAQGIEVPDLTKADFSEARAHIELALAMEPKLWRAHFYLGRIWRAQNAARDAAGEFTKAIQANPAESGPYIALAELYRRWNYTDAAIIVAAAGARNAHDNTSDLYFSLGMAHEDKGDEAKAIDAFNLAFAANDRNMKVLYQRGQAYFRAKDFAKAKADLEAFVKNDNGLEFARQQANKILGDLADKK